MRKIGFRDVWNYVTYTLDDSYTAIGVMMLVGTIWAIDLSLSPYLLKLILNRLSEKPDNIWACIRGLIAMYLGMRLLLTSGYRLRDYFANIRMVPSLRGKIGDHAFSELINKSQSFYQNSFSGTLASKVNDITASIPELVSLVFDSFFTRALGLVIAMVSLWLVNKNLAIFMGIWSAGFIATAFLFAKHMSELASGWSKCAAKITGRLVDGLTNVLSVKLFTGRQSERATLDTTIRETIAAERKLEWFFFKMWMCYDLSFLILQGLNFYILCSGYQRGEITIGDFAFVLGVNFAIVDFLWQIAKNFSSFLKYYGRILQALQDILTPAEIIDKPGVKELIIGPGVITFDQVHFAYKNTADIFQDLSITIQGGQKVGLVGYSGSGKSTFINLILRLYEVNSGRVAIDGQSVSEITQDSLYAHIGVIPQDPSLFHRTLLENIRYGRPEATEEEVIEASKKAHAHEFIAKLPDGYNSLVGERGVKLSGGQRQRIAIARAVLKNAPILILDEATSQLDSLTEGYIQESLWELMHGKTTIVIAHRLSTLLCMDRILVFEHGRIVQDGSHKQLLKIEGVYKTLWNTQAGGFIHDGTNA